MKPKDSVVPVLVSALLFGSSAKTAFCAPQIGQNSEAGEQKKAATLAAQWGVHASTSSSVPMVDRSVTVHFPEDVSLGRLIVILARGNGAIPSGTKVGGGRGTSTVKVPAGYWLAFEPNHVVFETPSSLNKVSPEGIDCLRISFTSLDDKEDGMCDKTLTYVSRFKGLKSMILTRSDVTDEGLLNLKNLPLLEHIEFVGAPVKGTSFSALSTLSHLYSFNCSQCQIEEKYFALLPQFKLLHVLLVNRCRLTKAEFQNILQCTKLTHLAIANNSIVDDDLIKSLAVLKSLRILDVRGTKATPAGIMTLKGRIPLKYLYLTDHGNSELDSPRLEKCFPGLQIFWAKRGKLDEDTQVLLSPLSP
ncbi:MAG TPA: hypothetical protein V6C97_35035 [Oculatellaceae cyanobacterium]